MKKEKSKRHYHNKLVRDKIPEIIEAAGDTYESRILDSDEFRGLLRKKLIEEAEEAQGAKTREDLIKELSDVLQVIKSIAEDEAISIDEVEKVRQEREEKRGVFKKRVFLVWSSQPQGK